MSQSDLYQALPSVDRLLKSDALQPLIAQYGHIAVTETLRSLLDQARDDIKTSHTLPDDLDPPRLVARVQSYLKARQTVSMRPVFNLTGVVLHTNLGRALWAQSAVDAATIAMQTPVTLEYNLTENSRGHRDDAISDLMRRLVGAEAACVVNNNAAAVLLMFAAMADQKEAIVSRGELIEIGGSFRIPDVMRQAGCRLVEVGTTNRTHLADYQKAIRPHTALIVKVHTSNYKIQGFTASVSASELAALSKNVGVPLAVDLGSGTLIDLTPFGLARELTVHELLSSGADLVSFSGDKLLGAPQAGIIVGKAAYIERLQKHPLKRALRCDKVTLAALEATLRLYLSPDQLTETLPTLRMLSRPPSSVRADVLAVLPYCQKHYGKYFNVECEPCASQIGSGALPLETIESYALTFAARDPSGLSLQRLSRFFHTLPQPVIGRIADHKLWLDLRCLHDQNALIHALTLMPFIHQAPTSEGQC